MTKPIKIIVRGTDNRGDDAPMVEDVLAQIQDFVSILHEIESNVSEDGKKEIVWRLTGVTKSSPITFEVTPYPKYHAMNIDRRASKVVQATANGFDQITTSGNWPMNFTDQIFKNVEQLFRRVTEGLDETRIDFSDYMYTPSLNISKKDAYNFIERIAELRHHPIAHKEIGSLEGFVNKVELDEFNRPIVWLRSRLDRQIVKCVARDSGFDHIGHIEVIKFLSGLRIRVSGHLNYKSLEQISFIEVEDVHVFESDDELPDSSAIIAPNFTNGLESNAYLKALRENG